ncbi:hypothetical protein SAMN05720465_2271 [Fibrobacter sp. UWB10]|nr:hypothetical protein SAMN05720465_2271 [Fibrobacter sp. UWB10]
MFKKFLILSLLGVSLSFATWGYFPLKDSDAGLTVKASHFIAFGDADVHRFDINARYVIGTSLEFALMNLGYQFNDPSGMPNPIASIRFQFNEKNLLFVEGAIPIGADYYTEYIHAGVQRALILSKHFAWSTELGLNYTFSSTEESYNGNITLKPGFELNFATEADFNAKPSFIWFIGAEAATMITESKIAREREVYDWYGYYYQNEEVYAGDRFDFGVAIFGGFNFEIVKHTFIEEEFSAMVFGTGKYDYSAYAFKTSLKHSF